MTHQIRHVRTSKFGKKFWAGRKLEKIEEQEPEEINILDQERTIEIDDDDLKRIREETGKSKEEIFDAALEIGSEDPIELIEALKEDEDIDKDIDEN